MLGVIQTDFLTIHQKISGLGKIEELELENTPGIYVPVRTLREDGEIREELDEADIILFLVSSHFLASDYIRGVEVMRAVERADCREVQLAPIILEKVDWEIGPFGKFNALPRKGAPIRDARPQRNAWYEIAIELRHLFERMIKEKQMAMKSTGMSKHELGKQS